MLKETGYQEKIEMVKAWLADIMEVIKRDLRNEHLKVDKTFCKRYFFGKNPLQVTTEEMASAYEKDIAQGNVGLGEFIATRWLLRNTDVYGFFEEKIKSIHADFENLEELSLEESNLLLENAIAQFGATRTYIFSVFNSVVFPREVYDRLKKLAETETKEAHQQYEEQETAATLEALQKRHAREVAAMSNRFEKKISGLQKKYLQDVETLKKQVSQLQKKLSETSHAPS